MLLSSLLVLRVVLLQGCSWRYLRDYKLSFKHEWHVSIFVILGKSVVFWIVLWLYDCLRVGRMLTILLTWICTMNLKSVYPVNVCLALPVLTCLPHYKSQHMYFYSL